MKNVRAWRWPVAIGLPFLMASVLVWRGIIRLNYDGRALATFSGDVKDMNSDISQFRSHVPAGISYERVPGQPLQFSLRTQGAHPATLVDQLVATGQSLSVVSVSRKKAALTKEAEGLQVEQVDAQAQFNQFTQNRAALLSGAKHRVPTPKAQLVAKIEELKARRLQLIERYPTHSDIPVLAKQIQTLVNQMGRPAAPVAAKVTDLDRQINESKLRMDYFSRRYLQAMRNVQSMKPDWKIVRPVEKPSRPNRVVGWPILAGLFAFGLVLGIVLSKISGQASASSNMDGLWRPEAAKAPETPVELEVVSPETSTAVAAAPEANVPMDPLTEKASLLYMKWVDVSKALYEPAPEPPQGILDQVAPLMEESIGFIKEGQEAMTKYLSRCVTSGDLPAHVARTVLMTLAGAQEAGVSPQHRLAMALAALFHDLAVVPRPAGLQEAVGSEVGRLSASVLRRIPGLPIDLFAMVEDILIGMDEFKLETWHNVANGNTLEPLSKVLREIDRFEKVMQKQKSRLDRRVANQ